MPPLASLPRIPARAIAGLALAAGVLAHAPNLTAQSIIRGGLQGTVREAGGGFLGSVGVTIIETRSRASVFAETNGLGRFEVSLLEAGDYEVLVEAPGFIPRLVTGVGLRSGQSVRVDVELVPSPPPVETVDTVVAGVAGNARFDGLGSRWVSGSELSLYTDPRGGLNELAALSPVMDPAMGTEGLPGTTTQIVLDGLPFLTAQHPYERGRENLPLLPRIGLANLDVHRRTDVEWSGAAGGYLAAMSRRAAGRPTVGLYGSGSTDALWQSEGFDGETAPQSTSGWGGGTAHLPLGDAGSSLFVGVEGIFSETPSVSPLSSEMAAAINAGEPSLSAEELSSPWVNEREAVSGLARLDWTGESTEVMARATFATVSENGNEYFSRPLSYGSTAPFSGTDIALSGSMLTRVQPDIAVEARVGIHSSSREWQSSLGPDEISAIPPTRFVGDGLLFGPDPGLAGTVDRRSFLATGLVHVLRGEHRVKAGLQGTLSSFEYAHVHGTRGSFLFGGPADAGVGDGYFSAAEGTIPDRPFDVPEIGVFIQHRWQPTARVRLESGLRFDYETLPVEEIPLEAPFGESTLIANNDIKSGIAKLSPRVALEWDAQGDGSTLVDAALSATYDHLDPGALNEVISYPGPLTGRRTLGDLESWPDLPAQGGENSRTGELLTVFGPDIEAPRTARATLGITQRIGTNAVFGVSGTFRSTQFLLRRSDENLAVVPSGMTAEGRPVYGELRKMGSLVVAEPGSSRRFDAYDAVWALNSDGWSRYLGVTFSMEYAASERLDLFASYAFSNTTDNLVGAREGDPQAQLDPRLGPDAEDDWDEAISDFDVPHRFVAGAVARFPVLEGIEAAGVYRLRSGYPFTAGYRTGVDVNGDGSGHNDPALVPTSLAGLASGNGGCLNTDLGGIASRNECRGDSVHSVNLHLSAGLFRIGSSIASLTLDVFNVTDAELGRPDSALLLVDEAGEIGFDPASNTANIPVSVNPNFGEITESLRPGRLIRVGFRLEAP